jgi:serine/threonine protein kinase
MSQFIGVGSYGCVIRPNLNCDGSFGKPNTISKFFFYEKDYLIEKDIQKKIDKIDKKHIFTIKTISSCKIKLTHEIKENIYDLKLCDLTTDDLYEINYEYGGIDLRKLSPEFLRLDKFINIFYGLSILNKNNLAHCDIKLDNILYDKDKNRFNIIDFGYLKPIDEVYLYDNITFFKDSKTHPLYPNEFNIIISYIHYKNLEEYNLNTNEFLLLIDDYIEIIKKITNIYSLKLLEIYNYFKYDIYKEFNLEKYKKINIEEFGNKIDVYMLGITLYDILIKIYLNKSSFPIKLIPLIKKMVLLNPNERITIQEATTEFKSIMKLKK